MARKFLTITQAEVDAKLAESLKARELELASYDFEHAGHEKAIADLGDIDWSAGNQEYRGLERDQMITRAIRNGLQTSDISKISDLLALDFHRMNLEAVKTEITKSERHYDSILEQLPEGERRDAALAALKAEE